MTNRLSKETISFLYHPEYWNKSPVEWGINDWDLYYIKKVPEANKRESHNSLGAELRILLALLPEKEPQYQFASSLKRRLKEADKLHTNIDLWNDDMKKLAKLEVNKRVNMRNLENMAISTSISAGIQHFEAYNSQLLISQQYDGMRFDSAEQERKRKAVESNEEASPRDRTPDPLRDDFFDDYGESEVDDSGIVEWEFDSAIPTWLEKGMLYHKKLISEENEDKRIKDSSKSIWWRIIDGSDLDVTREYLSEEEFLELQEVLANALELGTTINDWTILKPQAEKCLRDLSKLNNDQIKTIGENFFLKEHAVH